MIGLRVNFPGQREGIFKKRAKLKWRVVELVNCKSALRSNLRLAQIYFNFATFKCSSEIQLSKRFYFGFHTRLQWHFSKEFDAAVFTDRITKLRIILPWNQLSLTSFSIVLLQKENLEKIVAVFRPFLRSKRFSSRSKREHKKFVTIIHICLLELFFSE